MFNLFILFFSMCSIHRHTMPKKSRSRSQGKKGKFEGGAKRRSHKAQKAEGKKSRSRSRSHKKSSRSRSRSHKK